MALDRLLLLSGNDIPFPTGGVTIHQPSLKELAYITEQNFWFACELINFSKENLSPKDKNDLSNISNFNIIMMMIQDNQVEARQAKIRLHELLSLLFPTSEILFNLKAIQLKNTETGQIGQITQDNFDYFKEIVSEMFCLRSENKEYDPSGELAEKIADMIKRGREKAAKLAPKSQSISILSRYISILAVGEQKDLKKLMDYTVYQLLDEFNRFQLKLQYDSYIQFKCAGATDMKEPESWFEDIYASKQEDKQEQHNFL